jgi:pseudaminic acid biosynthesis-associated methylase
MDVPRNNDSMPDDPLRQWKGAFGQAYMTRNRPTTDATVEAAAVFDRILGQAGITGEVGSVLEVGANVGINLIGLRRVLGSEVRLAAIEPNGAACETLRANADLRLADVIEADAYHIPFPDGSFDLTFTNGVLIHVPPARLAEAMAEIVRVSRRYVLCSEYFSHTPVEIPYHGQAGLLWKRDFGAAYLASCPELRVRAYGFTWMVEFPHYDNLNWWMFERRP